MQSQDNRDEVIDNYHLFMEMTGLKVDTLTAYHMYHANQLYRNSRNIEEFTIMEAAQFRKRMESELNSLEAKYQQNE